ncbi:MAG: trypsin-like peptidase domain-containing protein [Anaerolineaceae bacterium]|nr:trypsin-like peptidase domain-containing protein [Anaerolineaceae bacterium]
MRRDSGWKLIGLAILISVLLAACIPASPMQTASVPTLENIPAPELPQTDQGKDAPSSDLLVSLYEQINPGVVAILIYSGGEPVGQGSGFVIDRQGHILTNYHVVENVFNFEVVFSDGYRAVGELVGTDPDSDIAVLKAAVPEVELAPLALGSSSEVKVGQSVVAIGNPYGLSGTMTVGIVSARGRLLDTMRTATTGGNFSAADLIQTDAAINPGNSGGPLLNLQGEVIGINRAIRTNGDTSSGIFNSGLGFVVPVDIVKRVVPYLIRDGHYDYPYLGITSSEEFTLPQLQALGLPPDMHGVYVITVPKGTPAEKAGLLGGTETTSFSNLLAGGDLITTVNGHAILNYSDFLNYLVSNTSPGDVIDLVVLRGGKELQLKATLVARPQ